MRRVLIALAPALLAAVEGYTDTPLIAGTTWHVHDPARPQPAVVDPGTSSTDERVGTAPSDAVVLFDGTDCSHWRNQWKIEDGCLVAGGGDLVGKDEFGDCQLHVEWSEPTPPSGGGQGRGNSGVFLMERYEIQVLDCFANQTYPDGQTGAIYGQRPPLVNACRAPGRWQSYDIVWRAPRFAEDGALTSPAVVTVLHNGVLVQDHVALTGPTAHRADPPYQAHSAQAPLRLQDHGNPVRYRNLWARRLPAADAGG